MPRVKDWGTRKDANHNDVKRWFEDLRCRVVETHMVPNFADLVVKCGSVVSPVEIKDPSQAPSARKLTKGEKEFWQYWGTDPVIVETQGDVINLVKRWRNAK